MREIDLFFSAFLIFFVVFELVVLPPPPTRIWYQTLIINYLCQEDM